MALPLYTITLFVSAFILFLIQPMIGKLLLPKLGGTPQVWNTCMVFFQMVLLAGYAYSHTVSTKLKIRQQLIVHGILLLIPFAVLLPLPFNIKEWIPDLGVNPILSTFWILLQTVALPFLVVATTAPLLQKWFVHTGHPAAKDPYFLYGASNLGSMLALLAYPLFIEPFSTITNTGLFVTSDNVTRISQPWIWIVGYVILLVTVFACIALVWIPSGKAQPSVAKPESASIPHPVSAVAAETGVKSGKPPLVMPSKMAVSSGVIPSEEVVDNMRRLRWVLLAAIPSSLMLGVTTFITTDLSPIPLFWLVPLTLYLASFILVFARWPIVWVEQPHTYMLYSQPIAIAAMLLFGYFFEVDHSSYLWSSVSFYVIGFFLTTMVCHGELAKDRPNTRHLTEFYLWMSVGGMLGGMFNGLFAPVFFRWGILEFPLAVIAACLIRPKLMEGLGIIDGFLASFLADKPEPVQVSRGKGKEQPRSVAIAHPEESSATSLSNLLNYAFPVVIGVLTFVMFMVCKDMVTRATRGSGDRRDLGIFLIYGVPLFLSCIFLSRPIRFGLSIAAVMLVHWFLQGDNRDILYQTRTYFGHIVVRESRYEDGFVTRSLTHGTTHHGLNYTAPTNEKDRADPNKNKSRLATTYYHRLGPAGCVMEMQRFNWFKDPEFKERLIYPNDARMPCSLLGTLAGSPLDMLVDLWSEPPFATVGLGTGTMASYGRPYQHVHYYEIDNEIRNLSIPPTWEKGAKTAEGYFTHATLPKSIGSGEVYFNYLYYAMARGCEVNVYMGDARTRMALPYENFHTSNERKVPGGGPENFYHMMVVDAFSSDAIPAHLLTTEAIEMYFKHLVPNGILCIHTSNRYVDLPKVAASIANKKGWFFVRGHDNHDKVNDREHSTSEWIMLCREQGPLDELARIVPSGFDQGKQGKYWDPDVSLKTLYVWTDDYTNLWAVMRGRRDSR